MARLSVPLRTRVSIFVLIGLIILLTAVFVIDENDNKNLHDILIALGVVIVSVSLMDAIFYIAGGNPLEHSIEELKERIGALSSSFKLLEDSRRIGLDEVHDCTGNFGGKVDWLNLIRTTSISMDLLGRTLYEWIRAPEFDGIVLDKIRRDRVSFRWLIMASDNIYLDNLEEDGNQVGETLKTKIGPVIARLKAIRSTLPFELQNNLQVRTFTNHPLYCSVLRTDDRYLITPYMHSVSSRNCPLIVISGRGTPWAIGYDREFDLIWNSASAQ